MKRHAYALAVVMVLLATGCNKTSASENSIVEESVTSNSEETVTAPETNEPVFTISSNNIGSLETNGNFYLIADYGDIGRAEYDMQYDDSGKYVGTFVYSYLAEGQSIDDFVLKANIPVNVADITCISEGMYFCFLMDNGLNGFDESLNQTTMYEKLCEQYKLEAPSVSSEHTGSYLLVEPSTYTVSVGDTTTVSIKHAPDDYEGGYLYKSEEPAIATIDDSGMITAVSAGEVTISATTEDGNHSCQFVLTVQ